MPLITREVRWFFDGSLPVTSAAWFAGARTGGQGCFESAVQPLEWRIDSYLRLPNADDVGVKLRQGRLEIKGCHSLVGMQRFGEDVEGEVSCWTKWTIDIPEREGSPGAWPALDHLAFLPVAKQRLQRSVLFTQEDMVEVPAGQKIDYGLHMELTRLRVADAPTDTHWSIGFEAFPEEPCGSPVFAKAVSRLLDGCPAKPLGAEDSMPYPRWLKRLGAGEHLPDEGSLK